jgi:hypothetical protein
MSGIADPATGGSSDSATSGASAIARLGRPTARPTTEAHHAANGGMPHPPYEENGLILVSFDIDGTLIAGDPPGPILFEHVAACKARGYVIGSSSDRTLSEQRQIWASGGIEVDFMCNKHRMIETTAPFKVTRRLHIGDTNSDEYYAKLAGFEFLYVTELPEPTSAGWIY